MRNPSLPRIDREDLAGAPRTEKAEAGPVPTLAEMHTLSPWFWINCGNYHCRHSRPVLIVHLMIALGVHASTDNVRAQSVCETCGHKGATIQVPSYKGSHVGLAPFPTTSA